MSRNAPLEIAPADFRELGHRLVDQIADRLAALPSGPVTRAESAEALRTALGAARSLPDAGGDPAEILSAATDLLFSHSLFNGHPRFFGYITSSPAPIGMLGDLLAAAVNPNMGAWTLAPIATEVEAQTVRWIAELLGYPVSCGGLLVSGGNMANFVCFLAARAAKAGPAVRKDGLNATRDRLVMYASVETHTWIHKAADLFGHGTDAIRWISTDGRQRMNVEELSQTIADDRASGLRPFLVVGTAGSVSTGAVDPLTDIGRVCREEDLWFHVDGAYGAFAAHAPDAPQDLQALADADSVAVDPHKWLYSPLEAGCALVRKPEQLRAAFSYRPPYYVFDETVVNFVDYGPQNSRGFRALKVWLALQQVGRSGALQMIGDDMRLSRRLFTKVSNDPRFEALSQGLSIATFRYVPSGSRATMGQPATEAYLNKLNEQLLARLNRSGAAFLSNAVINGAFALRACIVNFHTSTADIDMLPDLIAQIGEATALEIGA